MTRPFIVGIGGTTRVNSSSELALKACLMHAQALGAETKTFSAEALDLPHYGTGRAQGDERVHRLVEALRGCDGVVLSSPAYHGAMPAEGLAYPDGSGHQFRGARI
jgi:FMN reductase